MKYTILAALLLTSFSASAQYTGNGTRQNGQGVTIVTSQRGTIEQVGNPVYKNVPSRSCSQVSYDNYDQGRGFENQSQGTNVAGAVLGTLIGGAIGSSVGRGTGRDVAIAGGAAIGAAIGGGSGNGYQNQGYQNQRPQQRCETVYEQQLVGYWVIIRYGNAMLEEIVNRQVSVGDSIEVKVRSTVYLEK